VVVSATHVGAACTVQVGLPRFDGYLDVCAVRLW
jgi:hypothetical protein